MENDPHEGTEYPKQEPADDEESEIPSAHSPDEEWEDPADDEDNLQQLKRRCHNKGDSASGSSPAKRVADPEVANTGSSLPSANESTDPLDPLNMDPLDSALPMDFGRLPSVSLGSKDDEELRLVNIRPNLLVVVFSNS